MLARRASKGQAASTVTAIPLAKAKVSPPRNQGPLANAVPPYPVVCHGGLALAGLVRPFCGHSAVSAFGWVDRTGGRKVLPPTRVSSFTVDDTSLPSWM